MLLALRWTDPQLGRVRSLLPFLALAAVGGLVFAWMCDAVGDRNGVTALDGPVSLWFAGHRSLTEGNLGLVLARATSPAVIIALLVVTSFALRRRGLRRESALLAVAGLLAYAAGAVAKLGEHRSRPLAPVNLAPETEPSFPSGHVLVVTTIAFVALALAWSHLSRSGRLVATAAAVASSLVIAVDRLVVGAHWVTDVVGAVALAAVIVSVIGGILAWTQSPPEASASR